MGKKSRVKTQKSGTGATAAVSPKEMMNLISELLQKCSSTAPSPGKEWEEYIQIRALVEKIRKKQKGMSVSFEGTREEFFSELMAWATECGASCDCFEISNFADEGYGLKAIRDIKAEELFLWVPRKMLMTVESAKNSVLGPLYSQDRILQAMGNVTLAIHLLCERANPSSPWLPYIKTLPADYDTPLYFEEDEVRHLLATQAIQDVLSQYKNTARQYAYFYKVIHITTGYNLEDDRCECVALKDYKEAEQIYIFYGTRSNAEFVIHNGFFFEDNAHDRVKIKLGVSKSERLYAMKAEVLARAGIPASSIFALHCSEPPISAQLLAFLRVFCMTEEELRDYLVGDHAINKIFTLGNTEFPVSWENEIKLWTFLETRAALLLKTYKTTSEEDRSMLEKPDLSLHSRIAIKLRLAEKEILERAVSCGRAKRLHFQKQLDEGIPLPLYEESDIALLENADAKLPIILRKLEEEDEHVQEEMSLAQIKPDAAGLDSSKTPVLNGQCKDLNGTQEDPPGSDAVVKESEAEKHDPSTKRTEGEPEDGSK
uniref:protein-histidine N-methyltransferase n=1 Tax=Cyprinus carpio carpio TaxID=630221 RepID=A0A9J7ZZU5_CYPCA